MENNVIVFFLSFLSSVVFIEGFKRFQKKLRIGQYIREEGPDLHNYKTGTPTAAGLVFIPIFIAVLLNFNRGPESFLIAFSALSYGLIGAIDDFMKIKRKNASGITAVQKLFMQFTAAFIIVYFIQQINPHTYLIVPFSGYKLDLGWFYYLLSSVVIVGVSNAVNLTDGVDGLAGFVFIGSIVPLLIVGYQSVVYLSLIGLLVGFLWHNWHPASIFMGDAGSLALGGILATSFALNGLELFLIFFGFIFLLETLSVIIQVTSFKFRGKRVFRMSPIHHHFELLGWKEEKIAFRFSTLALLVSLLGIIGWREL
ncbi:phospho-N-acetylmuramoyl-pentapeptide-transferase [Kosmotoga sp. DU53]|uniref:phospho-N-acetylmuramoyl-pentapeptide- transferase n=1 Tax=Kosmotoga sp. DU53 TaxID=1310160 RepID=UPI0007C4C2EA|nr:phospho-N-acetylmuramoyl-pentapeptide-transferase [Kosmotoga sp. DU53]OAA20424.1 phospho-N-acetylmuramoyl-pentapeptide-transferase [Kosmotoga sp. DU53]